MIDERIEEIDFDLLNDEIKEAAEYIKEDDYDSAKEIIEELLEEYKDIYKEDENERYFCFDSPVSYYVYDMQFSPKKMIRPSKIDYRTFYTCLGQIDIAYEDYESAEERLKDALYWNPVDANIFFLLGKIYIKRNELSKLAIILKAVRNYILDKISYAKYYSYLGYYYLMKEDYKTALSLFYVSESIYETNMSKNGIDEILNEKECNMNAPTTEEVIETLKNDGFSYGLNDEILGMVYDLSYEMQKNLNTKGALYCLSILYELTGDEKYEREKEALV